MPPTIFAERRLYLRSADRDQEILVQFGPVIRQDGAAFCRFTVLGADESITREIWGVDDVQAVELAMKIAGSELDLIADGGRFAIVGTPDSDEGHAFPSFDPRAKSQP